MKPAASLRALVAHAVDYAGLFPPAELGLEEALRNYSNYVREAEVWMLGSFVLPIARFEEVSTSLARFDVEHRLRIAALGPKTEHPAEFMDALQAAAESIRAFNGRHGATASVTQIEMALPAQPGANVHEASAILADLNLPTFWETEPNEAERTINFLAERKSGSGVFGFKLRTGGVIASAFPSSIQIARALVAAVTRQVPIKFTAGLHHPVRQFHPSVQAKMHGFLNVLGAGVLAAEHGWDVQQCASMLEDEDASAFSFDDENFAWGEHQVSTPRIAEHRRVVTSLGSCSFDEPRDDLRALKFL